MQWRLRRHSWWAAPLARLYGAAVAWRRWAYDKRWLPSHAAPLRVWSVGGLEAGGTGKTPITGFLLAALRQRGVAVGLLTRGYRRRSRGLQLRLPGQHAEAWRMGDEASMLVAMGADVPVVSCADRVQGAYVLQAQGCQLALMDDGFVHRRLRRDCDIVVLRREAPVGTGELLPWGSLREGAVALRRADVAWFHGAALVAPGSSREPGRAEQDQAEQARLRAWAEAVSQPRRAGKAALRVVFSRAVVAGLADTAQGLASVRPADALRDCPVFAVSGLARPRSFLTLLEGLGASIVGQESFPDHHPYDRGQAARLEARARTLGARAVVVTGKDYVKLAGCWPLWPFGSESPGPPGVPLWPLLLDVALDPESRSEVEDLITQCVTV